MASSAKVTTKSVTAEQIYAIITPQTIRRDMPSSLPAASRTKPIANSEPTKAAATIPAALSRMPCPRQKIIVSATVSFAPEDTPSTKGPAIGLAKKVCSRKPETESAPPSSAAASSLGIRMLQMTREAIVSSPAEKSAAKSSRSVKCVLPAARFSSASPRHRSTSAVKQYGIRLRFPFISLDPVKVLQMRRLVPAHYASEIGNDPRRG